MGTYYKVTNGKTGSLDIGSKNQQVRSRGIAKTLRLLNRYIQETLVKAPEAFPTIKLVAQTTQTPECALNTSMKKQPEVPRQTKGTLHGRNFKLPS